MSEAVATLDDPRVAPFLDVTSRDKRESPAHFVAEGENVVLRLLASTYLCEKVLCVDRKSDRIRPHLQPGTELLVAPERLLQEIVGFKFHSGVMGLGVRSHVPRTLPAPATGATVVLVLPEITDSANLGAIFRVAAAFGVKHVILGDRCRDPFTRQTVRVSMGTIFSLQLIQSHNIQADLKQLRDEMGYELVATVLDTRAEPLDSIKPANRTALLLGNEGPGLTNDVIELCQRQATIPMKLNTDSLNVVTAAAVFLYHFTKDA